VLEQFTLLTRLGNFIEIFVEKGEDLVCDWLDLFFYVMFVVELVL